MTDVGRSWFHSLKKQTSKQTNKHNKEHRISALEREASGIWMGKISCNRIYPNPFKKSRRVEP